MKTLVFDLDGTMYRGTSIIQSACDFLNLCIEKKVPFYFLTNNSLRTRQENVEHMMNMGYTNIDADMFYNSAMASVQYVKHHYSQRKAYYVGKNGLKEALEQEGFTITEDHPDFVFVGLDKSATYDVYSKALDHLLQGSKLIGTNKDRVLASPKGFEVGNGSVVALFEYASQQVSPDIAKPSGVMLDLFLEHTHLNKEDIVLIGDNLDTDIKLGYDHGVETIFVQTGVHTISDLKNHPVKPDVVLETLMDPSLLRYLD